MFIQLHWFPWSPRNVLWEKSLLPVNLFIEFIASYTNTKVPVERRFSIRSRSHLYLSIIRQTTWQRKLLNPRLDYTTCYIWSGAIDQCFHSFDGTCRQWLEVPGFLLSVHNLEEQLFTRSEQSIFHLLFLLFRACFFSVLVSLSDATELHRTVFRMEYFTCLAFFLQSIRADTHRRVCLQSGCKRSLHGDMAKDVHRVMDSLTKTKEKKRTNYEMKRYVPHRLKSHSPLTKEE